MKSKHKFLPAACCISLLSACASNQPVSVAPWTIKPITAINANNRPEAYYQTGRYYQGQNRYDQAIEAYQKALAVDDKFVEARNGLGVILSRQGKYNLAIESFKLAIQQAPNATHLYSNMGYAYYLQGQYADAVAALVQATSLDPNNQHALNNLGLAYAKTGQSAQSMQTFSKAALQQNLSLAIADNIPTAGVSETVVSVIAQATTSSGYVDSVTTLPSPTKELAVVISPAEVMLVLPKDRGIIRPAVISVPMIESNTKLVQLEPNVSELQMQTYKSASVPPMDTPALANNSDNAHGKLRLEVSNGNGVAGLAGKVRQFLSNQGYVTSHITNQKPFQVRMTQIQYREGYQSEAQLLQASMPEMAELVQRNNMRTDIGIRVLLGKDIAKRTAYFDGKHDSVLVAFN